MGTPSVYSHVTTRSSANLKSSRSMRSIRLPWYQKPILQDAIVLDIQRGALVTGVYSLVSWYNEVANGMELEICLLAVLHVLLSC
jgi:hypothetical protein